MIEDKFMADREGLIKSHEEEKSELIEQVSASLRLRNTA